MYCKVLILIQHKTEYYIVYCMSVYPGFHLLCYDIKLCMNQVKVNATELVTTDKEYVFNLWIVLIFTGQHLKEL